MMSDEKIHNLEEKRAEKTVISTPEDFAELLFSFTAHNCDPNRPYTGQSHTNEGLRGKQEVHGITMRDVADCLAIAFARACTEDDEIHKKADDNTLSYNDLYTMKWIDFDPVAVIQCLTCEIEKRMGIFPNVAGLGDVEK